MKNILFFNEIDKSYVNRVGGKGANLGELALGGFKVPDGFCITTDFYREFINKIEIGYELLDGNLAENSKKIREQILSQDFSEKQVEEIEKALIEIKGEFFAVRSSATNEDNPDNSFAGQMDTYLNITRDEIMSHIKKCMASIFTERACSYRNINKISHEETAISIVVMEMVQSEVSGILFTANPLTNSRDEVVIDSSYGLGEALVSGLVDPDGFTVKKDKLEIVEKKLGKKDFIIEGKEEGKKTQNNIEKQSLSDEKIKELVSIGKKIELHYKIPMDVEWAMVDNEFYILQARPITTLFPLMKEAKKDDIFLSFNHLQVMTKPFSPLGMDVLKYMFNFDSSLPFKRNSHLVNSGGFLFLNITPLITDKKISGELLKKLELVNRDIQGTLKAYSEKNSENLKNNWGIRKLFVKKVAPIVAKSVPHLINPKKDIAITSRDEFIKQALRDEKLLENLSLEEKVDKLREVLSNSLYEKISVTAPAIFASFFAVNKLRKMLPNDFSYKLFELTSGRRGNLTTEMALSLNEISELFREIHIKEIEKVESLDSLKSLIKEEEKREKLDEFIRIHGCRGVGELDIKNLRYREDISFIKTSIINNLKTTSKDEYLDNFNKLKEETVKFEKELLGSLEKESRLDKFLIRKYIDVIKNNYVLREHHKYGMIRLLDLIKIEVVKLGKELVAKNLLEESSDIFYLDFDEIKELIEEKVDKKALIQERKLKYKEYEKMSIPKVISGNGEILKNKSKSKDGFLNGEGVSDGKIKGRVHVITNPTNAKVEKREILVVPFTDPGWTPLFVNASGLIMEVGGMMTHGAIVAREYRIPAIVGVDDATKVLKTGDLVEIDGSTGVVYKIGVETEVKEKN